VHPQRKVLEFAFVDAPAHVAEVLASPQVLRVKRLNLADGAPFAVVTVWCPAELGQHSQPTRRGAQAVLRIARCRTARCHADDRCCGSAGESEAAPAGGAGGQPRAALRASHHDSSGPSGADERAHLPGASHRVRGRSPAGRTVHRAQRSPPRRIALRGGAELVAVQGADDLGDVVGGGGGDVVLPAAGQQLAARRAGARVSVEQWASGDERCPSAAPPPASSGARRPTRTGRAQPARRRRRADPRRPAAAGRRRCPTARRRRSRDGAAVGQSSSGRAVAVALRRLPASTCGTPSSRARKAMVEPFGDGSTSRVPGAIVSRSVGDSDGSPSSRRPASTAPMPWWRSRRRRRPSTGRAAPVHRPRVHSTRPW
jgi:hypothetical protein